MFRRQLFHCSLARILQSLQPGMTTPEVVRCPDGHFRRVIYGIGPYIADYLEQSLVSAIVQGWCPKCLKHRRSLGDPETDLHRCREHTEELISRLDPAVLWSDYGIVANIRMVREAILRR